MHGFQLWANLPSALKMTAPRYQEVTAPDIPEVTDDDRLLAEALSARRVAVRALAGRIR